jgi:16S rRNA (adenine1518-N6/adenine1519-N6)-dimethyltransferase
VGKTKSRMGQVFLIDDAYLRAIADAARLEPTDNVLEIGMGRGQLTQFLVRRAARVVAVELNRRLAVEAERYFEDFDNLTILEGNILDIDLEDALSGAVPAVCVGNIPYYITGPIIDLLFEYREIIPRWLLLLQKEVARRVTAEPGSKEYGRLSVKLQYYGVPALELEIPREAFEPVPEVDSALVSYYYRDKPAVRVSDEARFFYLVDYLFGERRKKVRNRLPGFTGGTVSRNDAENAFSRLGISVNSRPQELSMKDFAELHNWLESTIGVNG